jgi:hypothetical protein
MKPIRTKPIEANTYKDKIYWDKTFLRQKLSGPNQLEDQTYYGTKSFRTKPICCTKPIVGRNLQLDQNYTQ